MVEGKFEVSVLWKPAQPNMSPNFSYAVKRDSQIFASRRMTEETFQAVNNIFLDYERKGYIRRIQLKDPYNCEGQFLPHFPVFRLDKETTKLRPVFDGAARMNGVSFNDHILRGPLLSKEPHTGTSALPPSSSSNNGGHL